MIRRFFEKLHNFRLLPVFVIVSMTIGIGLGKLYGISNFALTPPIDAIKAIVHGAYEFSIPNTLALGVVAGLFMMIYPAMTNIKFEDLGKAAKSPKQLFIVLFFNYAVAPFFMLFLAKIFLSGEPDLYTGLVLYGLAPCIAMVIVFTYLKICTGGSIGCCKDFVGCSCAGCTDKKSKHPFRGLDRGSYFIFLATIEWNPASG